MFFLRGLRRRDLALTGLLWTVLCLCPNLSAVAQPSVDSPIPAGQQLPSPASLGVKVSPDDALPQLTARSAVLMDARSGKILYQRDMDARRFPASTTKIMTLIVALENSRPDDIVTIGSNAVGIEGSSLGLREGDQIRMEELLTGMMMQSGNDATIAVAEHIAGSMHAFADMMTEKAKEIGAEHTNFVNSHGLPDDRHYTTAYDLAKIAAYGYTLPDFEKIVSTSEAEYDWIHEPVKKIVSENKLLWQYRGGNGVKTGYTSKAGRCLVSAAKRDGMQLVAVVLDSPFMWTDSYTMLDYGFAHAEPLELVRKNDEVTKIRVKNGSRDEVALQASRDSVIACDPSESPSVRKVLDIPPSVKAPLQAGEVVGQVVYRCDGKVVDRVDLIASEDVAYHTLFSDVRAWLSGLLKGWF